MIFRKIADLLHKLGRRPVRLTLVCVSIIALSVLYRHAWRGKQIFYRIEADAAGYYAYLPALLIHHDMTFDYFSEMERKYHNREAWAYFLNYTDGMMVNKYFVGEAVLLLPFFLIACGISYLAGVDVDGHNAIFQVMAGIGSLFYVICGLALVARMLRDRLRPEAIAVSVAAIFLGTNLFYYSTLEGLLSHAFSFFLICLFMWQADRSVRSRSTRSYLFLALVCGFICITRPPNILIVLLMPFLAGRWNSFVEWFSGVWKWNRVLPGLLIVLLCVSVQSVMYYLQEGKWWIEAYGEERFYLHHPEILNVLFSYRAGFFVWAPVTFIGVLGALLLSVRSYPWMRWYFLYFLVIVWIISSWWVWHYEGTFGARSMTDHLGPVIILLAYTLDRVWKWGRFVLIPLIVALIGLQQVQVWQRMKVILPWSGMDKAKYWALFLNTDKRYAFRYADLQRDPMPWNAKLADCLFTGWESSHQSLYQHGMEDISGERVFRGTQAYRMPKGENPIWKIPAGGIYGASKRLHIRLEVMTLFEDEATDGEVIVSLGSGETSQRFSTGVTRQNPSESQWHYLHERLLTRPLNETDTLVISSFVSADRPVWLDDLRLIISVVPEGE